MDQTTVNYIVLAFGSLIGFILKSVWDSVKDLQKSDKEITDKVAAIELLVAGQYVRSDRFDKLAEQLFNELRSINSKLDTKADRVIK